MVLMILIDIDTKINIFSGFIYNLLTFRGDVHVCLSICWKKMYVPSGNKVSLRVLRRYRKRVRERPGRRLEARAADYHADLRSGKPAGSKN